jgi:hypothetical protein
MYKDGKVSFTEYHSALNEKIKLKQDESDKKNYVETYVYYSAIRALMKEQGFTFRYQFDSSEDEDAYDAAYDRCSRMEIEPVLRLKLAGAGRRPIFRMRRDPPM